MTAPVHKLFRALFVLPQAVGLLFFISLSPAEAQMGKPDGLYYKSWAIIIGIEHYVLAPPIPGVIDDAKKVAQAFRTLGFDEVVELYDKDTSFRRLQQVLNDMLPRKVGRMDRLVIFYAGHVGTMPDSDGQERSYLVPFDAQMNNATKSVTVEYLKEFTRRSASKHTVLLFDAPVFGWETTEPETSVREGRLTPDLEMERRAVHMISAASKGEQSHRTEGRSDFVQALLSGLAGAADLDQNGWMMASELGTYLTQHVSQSSQGQQHPVSSRIDGAGDLVFVEGQKLAFRSHAGSQPSADRRRAAQASYEQAYALLQGGQSGEEVLAHVNRAIEYDPTHGNAYVLKSHIRLDVIPNLEEALASGLLAVQYAPDNPDSFYTLGLIHERRGTFTEAEAAFRRAVHVRPDYQDVYFSLGTLYADHLHDQPKSLEAFRRYLALGGTDARARSVVSQADSAAKP